MNEEQSYSKYQDGKSDVISGIEKMLEYGQKLGFDLVSIADDIKDQVAEVNGKLSEEF